MSQLSVPYTLVESFLVSCREACFRTQPGGRTARRLMAYSARSGRRSGRPTSIGTCDLRTRRQCQVDVRQSRQLARSISWEDVAISHCRGTCRGTCSAQRDWPASTWTLLTLNSTKAQTRQFAAVQTIYVPWVGSPLWTPLAPNNNGLSLY